MHVDWDEVVLKMVLHYGVDGKDMNPRSTFKIFTPFLEEQGYDVEISDTLNM